MKLKIGCTKYALRYSKAPIFSDEGDQLYGQISYADEEIRIWDSGDVQETLLHEVLHGIVYDRALALPDSDEQLVHALSRGLMAVIRDNPKFLKAISDA